MTKLTHITFKATEKTNDQKKKNIFKTFNTESSDFTFPQLSAKSNKKKHIFKFLRSWLTKKLSVKSSTNHKDIGVLYLIFGTFAGVIGIVSFLALVLSTPGNEFLVGNNQRYNVLITSDTLQTFFLQHPVNRVNSLIILRIFCYFLRVCFFSLYCYFLARGLDYTREIVLAFMAFLSGFVLTLWRFFLLFHARLYLLENRTTVFCRDNSNKSGKNPAAGVCSGLAAGAALLGVCLFPFKVRQIRERSHNARIEALTHQNNVQTGQIADQQRVRVDQQRVRIDQQRVRIEREENRCALQSIVEAQNNQQKQTDETVRLLLDANDALRNERREELEAVVNSNANAAEVLDLPPSYESSNSRPSAVLSSSSAAPRDLPPSYEHSSSTAPQNFENFNGANRTSRDSFELSDILETAFSLLLTENSRRRLFFGFFTFVLVFLSSFISNLAFFGSFPVSFEMSKALDQALENLVLCDDFTFAVFIRFTGFIVFPMRLFKIRIKIKTLFFSFFWKKKPPVLKQMIPLGSSIRKYRQGVKHFICRDRCF